MASDGILEVTDGNFDQVVLKSDQPVILDFWAAWVWPLQGSGANRGRSSSSLPG